MRADYLRGVGEVVIGGGGDVAHFDRDDSKAMRVVTDLNRIVRSRREKIAAVIMPLTGLNAGKIGDIVSGEQCGVQDGNCAQTVRQPGN
jgi:hypothetical protein